MVKLSIFLVLAALASANAVFIPRADSSGGSGITVAVHNATAFCSFLPATPGQEIGSSEDSAKAFCTEPMDDAPGATMFPQGFITSAHFASGNGYVQVTGKMNPAAYKLSTSDGGGQYDSAGAPPNAKCSGYPKFVNLVEPSDQRYCIRCCENASDCNVGESTEGCPKIIPGDYS